MDDGALAFVLPGGRAKLKVCWLCIDVEAFHLYDIAPNLGDVHVTQDNEETELADQGGSSRM